MPTTKITVEAFDNEIYILAAQFRGSQELCHLKQGFNQFDPYTIFLGGILPPGGYTLILVGINWAQGPTDFKVTVTTDGVDTVYQSPLHSDAGVAWSQVVNITV